LKDGWSNWHPTSLYPNTITTEQVKTTGMRT